MGPVVGVRVGVDVGGVPVAVGVRVGVLVTAGVLVLTGVLVATGVLVGATPGGIPATAENSEVLRPAVVVVAVAVPPPGLGKVHPQAPPAPVIVVQRKVWPSGPLPSTFAW
jgi:hypothetical protein